jgi:hypothetical protein
LVISQDQTWLRHPAYRKPELLAEQPIHCADRAVIDAFVEQDGVDFGWRLVGEARRV